jgi:hypothetical protein
MNPLYNKLMAEKGAPRAANNPNTTQMRGAPMNLRSAMQKYAVGGEIVSPPPSSGDIKNFVQANIENPQAIMQAAAQYGVSMEDLANATGYSSNQINDYFSNAKLGNYGTKFVPSVEGSGTFNVPPPEDIPLSFMPNEGFNEPEINTGYVGEPRSAQGPFIAENPMDTRPSSPSIPPGFVEAITRQLSQGNVNPFGSQINQQDELMKLLQALKAK